MDLSFGFISSLGIFVVVYGLIIFRNIKGINIPIWAAMVIGAAAVLVLGIVELDDAFYAINFDVIFFLLGMFVLVSGLESSGMLHHVTNRILSRAKTPGQILFLILFVMGLMSAFLINDTVALVATPIVIGLAKTMNMRSAPLLISLAFGVTIGSMMTPMGNPQNLLVALHSGMEFPLINFLRYLFLPTIACLFCTYFIVRWYYKKEFSKAVMPEVTQNKIALDNDLAKKSSILIILTVIGFFLIGIVKMFGVSTELNFSHVAILGGIVLLVISRKKMQVIRGVNWQIPLFFVAMFVFGQGLLDGGVIESLQMILPFSSTPDSALSSVNIIITSIVMSQIVSNVPFVAIYLQILQSHGFTNTDTITWVTLAGGSTLAGNLTVLGAASNVIILESAARRNGPTFSFREFFKIGGIVTTSNILVLIVFITLFDI